MIKFNGVFIQYVSEFFTLYDFNCEIKDNTLFVGDFFNGAQSIMRLISKIDKTYSGDILIDNVNIKNISDNDLNISYLPEKPVLFKNKSVFKNLCYPLKIRKISQRETKMVVENFINEIDKEFPLFMSSNLLFKKVKNLTLSEQKVVALIRAGLRSPKYVLMENYFNDLDEKHKDISCFILNKLKQTSTIIACEKTLELKDLFKDFSIIDLTKPQ